MFATYCGQVLTEAAHQTQKFACHEVQFGPAGTRPKSKCQYSWVKGQQLLKQLNISLPATA